MCGICGFIGYRRDQKEIIEAMMKEMEHRGPDSYGTYYSQNASFGFRRLSIIDLEEGCQPMESQNKSLTMVFNGEIYNYQELRREIEAEGVTCHTHSDTEVLVNGIQLYGEKMLNKVRGMFAFAVWDKLKQTLLLARDFFGIKPLYYAQIDGCLVFASEIKCILQFPGYHKRVNMQALEQYLSFQYSVLEETFFQGIYQLKPGSMLLFQNGKIDIRSYFSIQLSPQKDSTEDELAEQLDSLLNMTLKRHMVSDVEVGSFLSGGVDSAFIASASGAKRAFTVGFFDEKSQYNETQKAGCIARDAHLEHHVRIISKEEYWDALPQVMYHMDEPTGDASAVALYFLAQEASRYVKVVLSGEGADELFCGYPIYHEPLSLRWASWLPLEIRRAIGSLAVHLPDVKGRNYLLRAAKPLEERFIGNAYIFQEQEKIKLLKYPLQGPSSRELLADAYRATAGLKDSERMQLIDLNYWLPGDILQKADKMSMAHSLEVRVPYLDKDIYDFAASLPLNVKISGSSMKHLFRRVISKYVSQDTSIRKKLGFPIPIRVWLRDDDWYARAREMFCSPAAREYFQEDILLSLLDAHKSGHVDNSRKLWTVMMFLIWHKEFVG